jgi:hypothetical protein
MNFGTKKEKQHQTELISRLLGILAFKQPVKWDRIRAIIQQNKEQVDQSKNFDANNIFILPFCFCGYNNTFIVPRGVF